MFETVMHLAMLSFVAILAATVAGMPQAASQTTLPAAPAPTASGSTSSIQTYPLCAQICANETLPTTTCDVFNIQCACSTDYRGKLAACEESSCNGADIKAAAAIEQQLCAPTYSNNATLSSQVATAVAAATSAASYFTKGEDPTEPLNYPPCAQSCAKSHAFAGCGSYSNKSCICKSPTYASVMWSCYQSFCSPSDMQVVVDLSDALCVSLGGVGNPSNFSNSSVLPFTGGAPYTSALVGLWVPSSIAGAVIAFFLAL
ncbi:hypothetical protein N7G274_010490 [Stereocaulon virgatum]|uniref:CFEM domain-containing protein n=1 Tax=Stereocaulon virgatum TaxID=373712 RepID=A0ABR3ZVL2_9LECA